jgi:hypothetical protein
LKDIIYPRLPISKIPLFNPFGKYVVRLFINGSYKAIIIDDLIYADEEYEA